jgi:hypothetical protein
MGLAEAQTHLAALAAILYNGIVNHDGGGKF